MRVVMNLRTTAGSIYGGDTVVMRKLSETLRLMGIDVAVCRREEFPPADQFDVLHLFAIAPIEDARAVVAWARAGALPIVMSPLYYATFHQWFAEGVASTGRWRGLSEFLGRRRAWFVFRAFQQAKMPLVDSWRQMRELLLSADIIATSTHTENAYLAHHFRLGRQVRPRFRISPFGVDVDLYAESPSDHRITEFQRHYGLEAGYLVEVARIEPKKNQLAVIEALFNDDLPLVFVGQPSPAEPAYAERCREVGARRGRVVFIPWVADEELPLLYAGAAAHILPSWVELPGLSSLEAAASGCRVISSQYATATEILGDQARYCDPFDNASIRAAVHRALESPVPAGLRARLLRELTWQRAASANLALYSEVAR